MKKTIGHFHIVGTNDPSISATKEVTISLHDDQENIITVAVKPDLLQVMAHQLIAAARQAEAEGPGPESYLPVLVHATKGSVVMEPGQGMFMIFEVDDGLAYIFPLGSKLATVLRDELTDALVLPLPRPTIN